MPLIRRVVDIEVDAGSLRRAHTVLDKYQAQPMQIRMRRGTLQAARLMVNPIRSQTPVGKTGNLYRSIKAYPSRQTGAFGKAIEATVGPRSPHGHLVIRGHRIVTSLGRDTGQRARANPFVDRAVMSQVGNALRTVAQIIWRG